MKKFFKKHLAEIVAVLSFAVTDLTVVLLTKNVWVGAVIGFIATICVTHILAKTCAKNVTKIIEKGQKFLFYYLMATPNDLLNEEQEILLVRRMKEGSRKHKKMFKYYTECRYLSSKAQEELN